jgi:O-antigen ligase
VRDRVLRVHTIATASGRTIAWRGGLELAGRRPLQGYGFGAEEDVFRAYIRRHPDRFDKDVFSGATTHSSYLRLTLELGVLGLLLLLVALAAPLARAPALWRWDRPRAFAVTGIVASAAVLAFFSSYLDSVGNVLTLPVWLAAALAVARLDGPGLSPGRDPEQRSLRPGSSLSGGGGPPAPAAPPPAPGRSPRR